MSYPVVRVYKQKTSSKASRQSVSNHTKVVIQREKCGRLNECMTGPQGLALMQ